jgi:hypothetical protein
MLGAARAIPTAFLSLSLCNPYAGGANFGRSRRIFFTQPDKYQGTFMTTMFWSPRNNK